MAILKKRGLRLDVEQLEQGKRIEKLLQTITRKVDRLMAQGRDIKDALDTISTNLDDMAQDVTKLQKAISDLQAGQVISAEELQALADQAKGLADRTKTMADAIPD